jgi:hypothetical protein
MATQSIAGANSASFTTTAGTEAVIAFLWIPTGAVEQVNLDAEVTFTTVNAATTALSVKIRQGSFSGGHLVVSSPAGTQIGATASNTFTAGTLSTQSVGIQVIDFAPLANTNVDAAVPAQALTLGQPGQIDAGGFVYVLTVTSTTNTAIVAAQAAGFTASW